MAWEAESRRHSELPADWESAYRRPTMSAARGLCQIKGPRCTHRATEVDHYGDKNDHTKLRAACKNCHADRTAQQGVNARFQKKRRALRPRRDIPALCSPQEGIWRR